MGGFGRGVACSVLVRTTDLSVDFGPVATLGGTLDQNQRKTPVTTWLIVQYLLRSTASSRVRFNGLIGEGIVVGIG